MSATAELQEVVARAKAAADEIKKTSESHAELKGKFEKLAPDLEKLIEAAKKNVTRPSAGYGSSKVAAKLANRGIDSVKGLKAMELYQRDMTGAVTKNPRFDHDERELLELGDCIYIADRIKAHVDKNWDAEKARAGDGGRAQFMKSFPVWGRQWDAFTRDLAEVTGKALTSTGATSGDEWVPTGFASNLLDEVRLNLPTINLFPTINMPTNPWVNPMLSTMGLAYLRKVENTALAESTLATANRTWDAYVFGNYQAFSDEVSEDSIIAIAPAIRSGMVRTMGEGLEEAIVNGDNGATHFDFDYIYSSGAYRTYQTGFSGLRQYCLDNATPGNRAVYGAGGGALTVAKIGGALALMGRYGATRTQDLAILLNPVSWLQLLTETNSQIQTVDKYGPAATIVTGEMARIYGIPIFVSYGVDKRRASLHTTGINETGQTNNLSTAIIVNRQLWRLGDRRDVRFESDRSITAGRNDMVATARWGFNSLETAAAPINAPHTICIANIT